MDIAWDREVRIFDSSQIKAIRYCSNKSLMEIVFSSGDKYHYRGVDVFDFGELAGSVSVGKRWNHIKKQFTRYEKVEDQ